MSASETRAGVDEVRMELEADGHPIDAVTDVQIEIVGLQPAALEVSETFVSEDEEPNADNALSEDRLALIERYIAGHNILSSGVDDLRQADSKSFSDGSQVSYAGDRDHTGLKSTSLGQKAIEADPTNSLGVTRRSPTSHITDMGCE